MVMELLLMIKICSALKKSMLQVCIGTDPGNGLYKISLQKQFFGAIYYYNRIKFKDNRLRMITQIRYSSSKQSQKFYGPDKTVSGEESLDDLFQFVVSHDDYHAFEVIFNRTYKALCSLSSRMVKCRESAEEIVDDVFCSFWANRKRILINTSFQSYLTTSVRNRSLDCLRKRKHENNGLALERAIDIPCKQEIAVDKMVFHELNASVEAAINALPKQCRAIFLMSRDQGLMYKEIAELLNISIKTVDTQMGRALKHLRSALRPE